MRVRGHGEPPTPTTLLQVPACKCRVLTHLRTQACMWSKALRLRLGWPGRGLTTSFYTDGWFRPGPLTTFHTFTIACNHLADATAGCLAHTATAPHSATPTPTLSASFWKRRSPRHDGRRAAGVTHCHINPPSCHQHPPSPRFDETSSRRGSTTSRPLPAAAMGPCWHATGLQAAIQRLCRSEGAAAQDGPAQQEQGQPGQVGSKKREELAAPRARCWRLFGGGAAHAEEGCGRAANQAWLTLLARLDQTAMASKPKHRPKHWAGPGRCMLRGHDSAVDARRG